MNQIHSASHRHTRLATCLKLCACFLLTLVLAACSSVKENVNKDPVKARSFSFLNTGARQTPDYAENRREAHVLTQQAITKNLANKGVNYVVSGGDITVGYLIIVGNNTATTSLNSYFGYSDDSQALVNKMHSEQTGSSNRGYFEAGTLVIDFINPGTSKLLQRRSIHAQVLRDLSTETRGARIQQIVDQCLSDLPITH